MKPTNRKTTPLVLALLTAALTIGLISWDYKHSPGQYQLSTNDTTPKKKATEREKKTRDLDEVLNEMDRIDFQVEMEKAQKEIAEAMKNFDGDKIKMEIEKAMKEVDMAKIQKEVQESLSKINWDKMKLEIEKVKEIDMKKFTEEMKKVQEEMQELGPKIKSEMEKAKVEMQKAKKEMKEFKGFVDGLSDDGLISKKEGYTLKHKNGELFINGKKATEQTYIKYRNFLEKHEKFSIKKTDDDFDIDMD